MGGGQQIAHEHTKSSSTVVKMGKNALTLRLSVRLGGGSPVRLRATAKALEPFIMYQHTTVLSGQTDEAPTPSGPYGA